MSTDDGAINEFTSQPVFWVLGLLTVVSCIVTIIKAPNQVPESYDARRPHWTRWLTPYITSRPRQLLFALPYLAAFSTQVLMLRWVGMTGARWIQAMFDSWPAQGGWAMQSHYYVVSILVLILLVLGSVLVGAFMAVCQFQSILELMYFNLDAGRGEKREGR
ncbi:uncharacterized protein B0H64DRAFT_130118 [Chaetomium fimeti]|uniref:Uncharacterized protein n=1 Tax=Chaetomium fimeti TaxID=1854472 RepID=A0AAE0HJQ0_9PEZI|nr:hypothetical protein B0H64DRAFT_130118 [Chaetomium fimeti]